MKKRILSLLLVVAMLVAMVVVPAYAEAPSAADYNNTPDTCPCCGEAWSEITWTDFNATCFTNAAASGAINTSGHYQLSGDVTGKSGCSYAVRAQSGGKVVLDLNGYTVTNNYGRPFRTQSSTTLYIVDRSPNSTGFSSGGTTTADTFLIDTGTTVNIYAGTFTKPVNVKNNGGVFLVRGNLNIYGGIYDASAYNQTERTGGVIYVDNTGSNAKINIFDGHIIGGTSSLGGGAICAAYGTLTISGGYISGSVMAQANPIVLTGDPTMTCLDLAANGAITTVSCSGLTGGSITVNAVADTPFTQTAAADKIAYFKSGVSGYMVGADTDNKLILTTPPTVDGTCPHCGVPASWEPWTAAVSTTLSTGGHYYLYEDVQISDNYIIGANICLDLNGHDISGTSNGDQLFWVNSTATLNICDVSDSGNSELKAYGNCDGGVAYISGNLNIKGGTKGISLSSTAPTPGSGTPTAQGGLLRVAGNSSVVNVENCALTGSDYAHKNGGILHNGGSSAKITFTDCTLNGSHVSGNGGAISTATGTITLNNCTVNGGEADGYGGAIAFTANGKLNLNNTTVVDGTAAEIDGHSTAGIYHATYGGNTIDSSTVGSLYTMNNGAWITLVDTVTIANIILDNNTQSSINKKVNTESMSTDSSVGLTVTSDKFGGYGKVSTAGENAADKVACFHLTDKSDKNLVVVARDLDILVEYSGVAAVDAEGNKTWKATADEALALSPEYLLLGSVSAIEVNTDAVIDVNGNDVTISGDAEVKLFDSANVNYISYGDVTLDGTTLANEVEYTALDGNRYIKVENEGAYSFHILNLRVSAIGLRTITNGMYYYANYQCDETLKAAISHYGIGYSLYDMDGTSKIVDKTQAVAIDSSELALTAFEDIPIGSMNGIIGSDINGYSDSECGQMKIGAQPFVVIDGQVVSGIEVKYSMYDCCAAVDELITELNAGTQAEQTKAAEYVSYMENLFDVVWADYELGWNFTNFNKAS